MPDVVVGALLGVPGLHQQRLLGPVQRLNLALFVSTFGVPSAANSTIRDRAASPAATELDRVNPTSASRSFSAAARAQRPLQPHRSIPRTCKVDYLTHH